MPMGKVLKVVIIIFLFCFLGVLSITVYDLYFKPKTTELSVPKNSESTLPNEPLIEKGQYDFYNTLNDQEKELYESIEMMIQNFEEEIETENITLEEATKVFTAIRNDCPGYFWIGEFFAYGDGYNVTKVRMKYPYEETEKNRRQEEINKVIEGIKEGLPNSAGDYEKVRYIYDTIVKTTAYERNAEDQNIYSALVLKKSVCAGYAKTVQLLLKEIGIETSYVLGTIPKQGPHAWNIIKVNGGYYYLDATWGEFDIEDDSEPEKNIRYDYFCVNTQELLNTHEIDEKEMQYPVLTETAANYFVREGLVFNLNSIGDKVSFETKIKEAIHSGEKYFHFKGEDSEIMEKAEKIIGNILGDFYWYKDEQGTIITVVLY